LFLDTKIETSEGRLEFVNNYLKDNPNPNEKELEWLAD
jgi:hypothetical protein